jgi:hypothetical protein
MCAMKHSQSIVVLALKEFVGLQMSLCSFMMVTVGLRLVQLACVRWRVVLN